MVSVAGKVVLVVQGTYPQQPPPNLYYMTATHSGMTKHILCSVGDNQNLHIAVG